MQPAEQPVVSSVSRLHDRNAQFTSKQKIEVVMRLLKGESAETVSRELGVPVGRIERWKSSFVAAGSAELARRKDGPSTSWLAKHLGAIWQFIWLLVAIIVVVVTLVLYMQNGSPQ